MSRHRVTIATVDGRRYAIPDAWLQGVMYHHASFWDAVRHWHQQVLLDEQQHATTPTTEATP